MAAGLDEQVAAFRTRPLDRGPYTFLAAEALVLKVREAGRVVNVHALIAVGVNADGHRERSACRSPRPRTAPAGWRSSATWSPAACPVSRS
jgi:putative transposase